MANCTQEGQVHPNGPGSEIISGTKLIPTFRTVAFTSWTDQLGRLEFVAENDADKEEFFVPRVIEQLPLIRKGKESKDRVFPEKSDGQSVALLLGLKLVKNGAVAIFCGRKSAMLSSVLRSKRAVLVNVAIIRTFVKIRQILVTNRALARKVQEHDRQIANLFDTVEKLLTPPSPAKKHSIGYIKSRED